MKNYLRNAVRKQIIDFKQNEMLGMKSRFFLLKDSINFYNAINHHLVYSVTQVVWSVCDPIIHGHYYVFTIKTNALTNYYATLSPEMNSDHCKIDEPRMCIPPQPAARTIDNVTTSIFMIIITKKGILKYFMLHNPNGTWVLNFLYRRIAATSAACLTRMQCNHNAVSKNFNWRKLYHFNCNTEKYVSHHPFILFALFHFNFASVQWSHLIWFFVWREKPQRLNTFAFFQFVIGGNTNAFSVSFRFCHQSVSIWFICHSIYARDANILWIILGKTTFTHTHTMNKIRKSWKNSKMYGIHVVLRLHLNFAFAVEWC